MSQPPTDHGYGYGYPPPVQQRPTDTMAILGLVFAFVFPVLGVVFSLIGLQNVKRDGTNGRGLALAGLWVSIASIALVVLFVVGYVALFATMVGVGSASSW